MRKILKVPVLDMPSRQGAAALPRDEGGPVFAEPWQAHAFAIVMALYEEAHYTWAEWDDYLGYEIDSPGYYGPPDGDHRLRAEIASAKDAGAADGETARPNYSPWIAACEDDGSRFFDRWLAACEKLLVIKGLVTKEELDDRTSALAAVEGAAPRFACGDRIVVRNINPVGHTHLPLYLRSKNGIVHRDRGVFIVPEAGDHGGSEKLQHVYSVRFAAREIWGSDASDRNNLHFNVWDSYMDPA